VTTDLEITGPQETFIATLTYDTLDLYGKMEAVLPIVIQANSQVGK
jgi:hypothetical protein